MTELHPTVIVFTMLPDFFIIIGLHPFGAVKVPHFLTIESSVSSILCIYAAVILSPLIKLISLAKNSFLVFFLVPECFGRRIDFPAVGRLCRIVNLLYDRFDGKAFLKTSQPIVVFLCDSNHASFFPSVCLHREFISHNLSPRQFSDLVSCGLHQHNHSLFFESCLLPPTCSAPLLSKNLYRVQRLQHSPSLGLYNFCSSRIGTLMKSNLEKMFNKFVSEIMK
jgi:hypothetical protein